MTVNLTPASVFPTNFRAPDDGDSANGALFQQCFQDAADAATNLKGRVDGHDASIAAARKAIVAQYTPSASALANNGTVTLAQHYSVGGFALNANGITVPSAGVYRATLKSPMEVDSTSNPRSVVLRLMAGAVGDGGSTVLAWFSGIRFSANADHSCNVVGCTVFEVTDPPNQTLWLQNRTSGAITTSTALGDEAMLHSLVIERVGDLL